MRGSSGSARSQPSFARGVVCAARSRAVRRGGAGRGAARTLEQRILNLTVPTLFLIFTERASLRRAKRRNSRMSEIRFGMVEDAGLRAGGARRQGQRRDPRGGGARTRREGRR